MDSSPRGLQVENHRAGKELEQKERKAWKGGNGAGRRVRALNKESGGRQHLGQDSPSALASPPAPHTVHLSLPICKEAGMEASHHAHCDQCSQGLTSHECQSQKDTQADLHPCLLWVRLQPWHCRPSPGVCSTEHTFSAPPAPWRWTHPNWTGGGSRSKHAA